MEILNRILKRESEKRPNPQISPKIALENDRAKKLINHGQYQQAINCLDKVLEINSNVPGTWINKGYALYSLNRLPEAISCYDCALKIDKQCIEAWNGKGMALKDLNNFQGAIECYDEALSIDSRSFITLHNKAFILAELKRYDDALRYCESVLKINPKYYQTWATKGSILAYLNRFKESLDCYDKALEIYPLEVQAWNDKANILTILKRHDEALFCHDRAISIKPNFDLALSSKANTLIELEKYEDAIKYCDKALKINKGLAEAWNNKGYALQMLDKFQEALECCDKAVEIDPKNRTYLDGREYCRNLVKECGGDTFKINHINDQGQIEIHSVLAKDYYAVIGSYFPGKSPCLCGAKLIPSHSKQMECKAGHVWFINDKEKSLAKVFTPANEFTSVFHAEFFKKRIPQIKFDSIKKVSDMPESFQQNKEKVASASASRNIKTGPQQQKWCIGPSNKNKELEHKNSMTKCNPLGGRTILRDKAMTMPFPRLEMHQALAKAHMYFVQALEEKRSGNVQDALALYDCEIKIREYLVKEEDRHELIAGLAECYSDKAEAYFALNNYPEAIEYITKAIEIYEQLVIRENYHELTADLALCYQNKASALSEKANVLKSAVNFQEAVEAYDCAIKIYNQLIHNENHHELTDKLAKCYLSKSADLTNIGKYKAASENCDCAIEIYEQLVKRERRRELSYYLGRSYMYKAISLHYLGTYLDTEYFKEAIVFYDRAIELFKQQMHEGPIHKGEGRDLYRGLGDCYFYKATTLHDLGETDAEIECREQAYKILKKLVL